MKSCYVCGALFSWSFEGARRYRNYDNTPKGQRCADRNACRNRKDNT